MPETLIHGDHIHDCHGVPDHDSGLKHHAPCGDGWVVWGDDGTLSVYPTRPAIVDTYVLPQAAPEPAVEAPTVLVGSDAQAPVPDVPAVLRIVKAAEAAGWTATTRYAVAEAVPRPGKPARLVHTVSVRVARGDEAGWAIWQREDLRRDSDGGYDEGKWAFGDAQFGGKQLGARQIAARLASTWRPPGAVEPDDAPAVEPDAAPLPPAIPGTWGSLHAGDIVTGADGRGYLVNAVEPQPTAWVGSGAYQVRIGLTADLDGDTERDIWLHRPANEPVVIGQRADQSDNAAAFGGLIDAGITPRVISEQIKKEESVDQFSAPAQAPASLTRMEPPRGQWRWYRLPDPNDPSKTLLLPPVTTIIKTMASEGGLTEWGKVQVARGLAKRPDLVAVAGSLDPERDKGKMREVIEQAEAAAGSKSGANLGTAIDRFTERLDAGESVQGMGVPDNLRPAVEAYATTLARYGLTVLLEYTQRTVLNTTLAYAGTWDRLVRDRQGRMRVLDVKSNKVDPETGDLPDYHWFEWGQQFGLYNHGEYLCNLDFTGYDPMPHIDNSVALVLHLPIVGEPAIYEVDTIKGWVTAQGSIKARGWRSEARKGWHLKLAPPTQPSAITALIAQETAALPPRDLVREALDACTTVHEIYAVMDKATEAGVWSDAHADYGLSRSDLIRVSTAPDMPALAALWDEIHPAGRWSEAVNAAAAARWEQLQPAQTPVAV